MVHSCQTLSTTWLANFLGIFPPWWLVLSVLKPLETEENLTHFWADWGSTGNKQKRRGYRKVKQIESNKWEFLLICCIICSLLYLVSLVKKNKLFKCREQKFWIGDINWMVVHQCWLHDLKDSKQEVTGSAQQNTSLLWRSWVQFLAPQAITYTHVCACICAHIHTLYMSYKWS